MLGIPGWEQDGIADRVVQRGWEHWEQWNEAISSCSILPIVQSWPAQSHCCSQYLSSHPFPCTPPGRGTPDSSGATCVCLSLIALGVGALHLKPNPCLLPHRAPHLQKEWQYGGNSFFVTLLMEQGRDPSTAAHLGQVPLAPCSQEPCWKAGFPISLQTALPACLGGIKMGKSGICCSYLQLRNVRAVKLISWWNFPL